jgi:hypothetical protein
MRSAIPATLVWPVNPVSGVAAAPTAKPNPPARAEAVPPTERPMCWVIAVEAGMQAPGDWDSWRHHALAQDAGFRAGASSPGPDDS